MTDITSNTYNPDVLTCIANLSNDEVFTPPAVARAMLDMLPQTLFSDPNATFLEMKAPKLIQINYSSSVLPRGYIFGKRVHFAGRVQPGWFCYMEVAA